MEGDALRSAADDSKNEPESYVSDLPGKQANQFQAALKAFRLLDCSGRELAAFFDNRAAIQTVRQWRYGYRNPPQWAIDLLRAKTAHAHALALEAKAGPGKPVGNPQALRRWRATQRQKRA